jgi:hypothetical protein
MNVDLRDLRKKEETECMAVDPVFCKPLSSCKQGNYQRNLFFAIAAHWQK